MNGRICLSVLVFAAVVGLILLWTPCTLAQDGGFTETFDDPSLPGWEHSPNVGVINGVLRIEPGGFALRPGQWNDFTLSMRAKRIGNGFLATHYRASGQGAYIFSFGDVYLSLGRESSGAVREIGFAPIRTSVDQWVQLSISVNGGVHTITLDNQTVLTVTDSDPLPAGGLLLRADGGAMGEFDDLALTVGSEVRPPAYEAGAWVRMGGPPGGLGYDIRMRPDNPDIMYVTDAFSGIHKSVDGGHTWFDISEDIVRLHGVAQVFCATIDPHDYDSVWAGTQFSGHIYLSTNGGETWEVRDNGIIKDPEPRSVRGITIDPNDPNVIYAGVEVGTYFQQYPAYITTGEVYRSVDRGLNWRRIWQGESLARYVWVDPRDSDLLYVSTGIFDRTAHNYSLENGDPGGIGVVRSKDGGKTWEELGRNRGLRARYIPSLFMHPTNPDILIAAAIEPAFSPYAFRFPAADTAAEGVYVTYNGGDTWQQVLQSLVQAVEISVSNPDIWYAAGEGTIWRSDDAGRTWQHYPLVAGEMKAGLPIDLQVDPRDPCRIFDNNYGGGNFLSEDGGQTWVDASRGYTGAEIGSITVAPGTGWLVFANGFISQDGGQTWVALPKGGGAGVVYPYGDFFGILNSDVYGYVWHSLDGGRTWTSSLVFDLQSEFEAGRISESEIPMRALATAPDDPQIVYTGFVHGRCPRTIWFQCSNPMPWFFRSRDGGYTWERAPDGPWQGGLLRLAIHPANSKLIYGATGSGLYKSQDGGDTWRHLETLDSLALVVPPPEPESPPAANIVLDVILDPFDPNVVYAATAFTGVFVSGDGGDTWRQASAGMNANESVIDLEADPNRQGVIYAATDMSGVFVTTDGGQMWRNISGSAIYQKRTKTVVLNQDGSVLYVGSYFSGVYRLGTPAGSPP